MVLDTSGLLAAVDSSQRLHAAAREALESASGPLLVSPFVLAELDYLVLSRIGHEQEAALLGEVERGTYRLEPFSARDVARAVEVIEHYMDFPELGLTGASNVVLAERHGIHDILTLDERHFRAVRGPGGHSFRLLPADL